MTGKVWLVGAGPSDPGLFTMKGKRILEQAQVVVYDALVGASILNMIPEHAELINVGKRANNHTMVQEDINQVLLKKAQEGKRVVRLKGGDPFLFGRGGEELELLSQYQIPYEVVPGVTSALAVPAYNGIPVTHRDFCSSLHIITGHKKAGDQESIDYEALVKMGGTFVFLMGVASLGRICGGLLAAGMDPDTPAAILQKGTTARQKRIVDKLATLEEEVKRQGVETPAIIVVGKVCSLAKDFEWYEKLPLSGCRILLTRPKELISVMAQKLRDKGAEVLEMPAIRTQVIAENERLYRALSQLDTYQWLAFTSPAGVRIFFEQMQERQMDLRKLSGIKIAAIGSGTQKELRNHGLYADLIPKVYDGEHLGKALAENCQSGARILLPRAAAGNPEILQEISKNKAITVEDVPLYDTLYETSRLIDEKQEFEQNKIDYAVFTSASTVKGFAAAIGDMDYSCVNAVCIGKQTKAAADALGMKTQMSKEATMESLVEKIEQVYLQKK